VATHHSKLRKSWAGGETQKWKKLAVVRQL